MLKLPSFLPMAVHALVHGSAAEELRSQDIASQLNQGECKADVWPRLGLDAMLDAMSNTAGVVGVDSGLSHMAVALDLPHVQIYNFDTAWRTGPIASKTAARQVSVYAIPAPSVDVVWRAWLNVKAAGES